MASILLGDDGDVGDDDVGDNVGDVGDFDIVGELVDLCC